MALSSGTRIGPYEVIAPLGAGGMGEVYRARDTALDRDIAIKILPTEFAHDEDRLRRFQVEARAASALNHPGILTVHGFGTHEGAPFLVTELLEGEDLRHELGRGPLPIRRTIGYAQQLASGLAAAHDKGIVHRDLKPDNIFVTIDGRVKILDFGLAKLASQAPGVRGADLATQPLTGAGLVIGTVGYMSPEQVRGQEADHRSDIFSFGLVLYELLAGRRAFARDTGAETLTALLKEEPPDLSEINSAIHPALEKIVRRCLEKSPEQRFRSAHDLAFALSTVEALSDARPARASTSEALPVVDRRSRTRERLLWLAASAVLILATFAGARAWFSAAPSIEVDRMRFAIPAPEGTSFGLATLSPDGRWLAFAGVTGAKPQLWIHAMDGTSTRALAGTEGAVLPFWSPDSRSIGFFASGKLRRVDVGGGVPLPLADVFVPTGGTWSRDGVILFGMLGGSGLSRVPASGGAVATVLRPDASLQESDYFNPHFLPDGKQFLYNVFGGRAEGGGVFLGSLDGAPRRRLVAENASAAYAPLPSGGGALFFTRETALLAQRFDPERGQLAGEPVQIVDHVGTNYDGNSPGFDRRNFSVSTTGVLVFNPVDRRRGRLVWVDRAGQRAIIDGFEDVVSAGLSPDGRRFAATRPDGKNSGNSDLWIADANGSNVTRLSFDPANDVFPVWSPDGARIRWSSNRGEGVYHIFERAVSGSGEDRLLFQGPLFKFPTDWSRDGQLMFYRQIDPKTGYDIWFVPAEPRGKLEPTAFLNTPANEAAAVLSPSGQWIAYASDESGKYEVYVQRFPSGGGRRQISNEGGGAPHWRADGRELFFHARDSKLMAVPVHESADSMTTGTPVALFEFLPAGNLIYPYYSVTADGQRFLLNTIVESDRVVPLSVLVNWHALMRPPK